MNCHSGNRSILDLAQLFFGFVKPTDPNLRQADDGCPVPQGFDQTKFTDEIGYLRAFAIHYSTCLILAESAEGNGLRTAFMRIWDKAASSSAASMDRYNAFFKRIELYGNVVNTDSSVVRTHASDRISRKFVELLGDRQESSSLARFAAFASVHFNTTCAAVAEALRKSELKGSMSL